MTPEPGSRPLAIPEALRARQAGIGAASKAIVVALLAEMVRQGDPYPSTERVDRAMDPARHARAERLRKGKADDRTSRTFVSRSTLEAGHIAPLLDQARLDWCRRHGRQPDPRRRRGTAPRPPRNPDAERAARAEARLSFAEAELADLRGLLVKADETIQMLLAKGRQSRRPR